MHTFVLLSILEIQILIHQEKYGVHTYMSFALYIYIFNVFTNN
jgi:hypothetical protein